MRETDARLIVAAMTTSPANTQPYTQPVPSSAPWARVSALIYDPFLRVGEAAGMRAARKALVDQATGRVLEVGAGTGLNMPHYPPAARELILVEPEPAMRRRLERRVRRSNRQAIIVDASAEQLPLADRSVDTVVSTLVLCTVEQPDWALAEIARVLRPGGQLLFIEHVRAESPALAWWQDRLLGPWRRFACGCRCNRATVELMRACGFEVEASKGTWRGDAADRAAADERSGTIAATALPLIYYAILQDSDSAWAMGATVTKHHVWSLSGAVWPLALLLDRRRAGLPTAAREFPWRSDADLAGCCVDHLDPLADRAGRNSVRARPDRDHDPARCAGSRRGQHPPRWRRVRGHQLLGAIAVAIATLPASIHLMSTAPAYIEPSTHNQNLISISERQAFRYLARDPQPGGVLSSYRLGDAVPGETGRRTYGGDFRWSGPHFATTEATAWRLLHGQLPAGGARAFVLGTRCAVRAGRLQLARRPGPDPHADRPHRPSARMRNRLRDQPQQPRSLSGTPCQNDCTPGFTEDLPSTTADLTRHARRRPP